MYIELDAIFGNEGALKEFDYEYVLPDEMITSPVHVSGSIYNKTGIVNLKAKATYTVSAVCARCNAPIVKNTTVPVEHCLIAHAENEDNDYYIVVENMRLDLDGLVSEDIFLAMPSRFLCSENCRGLCPVCGADLNVISCGCTAETDPRWDVLKDLF